MSLRDWSDGSRDRRTWSFQLEFVLVTVMVAILLLLAGASLLWPAAASAHPGGLATDGCHNDRKNGGRHCHRGNASAPPERQSARGGVYYANCAAARAAGAAPVRRGDPGYAAHLDRDSDGVGCE
jgi:hypothetical protein